MFFSQAISIKEILKRCKIKKICFKKKFRHKLPFQKNISLIFLKSENEKKSLPREANFETNSLTCKPKKKNKECGHLVWTHIST